MLEIEQISRYDEPTAKCPRCGGTANAEWVSVYQDPFEVQVEPFHCECGWTQECPYYDECIGDKCVSFNKCYPIGLNDGIHGT
jgi:hypothetical protein